MESVVDQVVDEFRKPKPALRTSHHPLGCSEKATRCRKCSRRLEAAKTAKAVRRRARNQATRVATR